MNENRSVVSYALPLAPANADVDINAIGNASFESLVVDVAAAAAAAPINTSTSAFQHAR